MIQSRRRRYHSVSIQPQRSERRKRIISFFILGAIVLAFLWLVSKIFLSGGPSTHSATVLETGARGRVSVIINGENSPQRAETGLRLYEGDRIQTDSAANAELQYFDGTTVVLNGSSKVLLGDALKGEEESRFDLTIEQGTISITSGTGTAVERLITTKNAEHTIPPLTQAIIGDDPTNPYEEIFAVFATSGPGANSTVRLNSRRTAALITGEGQQLTLTAERLSAVLEQKADPYSLRGIIRSAITENTFVRTGSAFAREERIAAATPQDTDTELDEEEEQLVITSPKNNAFLESEVVVVEGKIGSRIETVRINGYIADIDGQSFRKEIALGDEEEFQIDVQAEDKDGISIDSTTLTVQRDIRPPEPPTITSPALRTAENTELASEPVVVNDDEFELSGNPSEGTIGIIVNGYRLQKFRPGNPWSYLVDAKLGNVKIGENLYEVVAVDKSGNKSAPVQIVVLWKAEAAPVITGALDEQLRDGGTYKAPGSLTVIAPTNGTPYETSENEVLIEGLTHPDTASISINGYRLSLYNAGKETWNYIAKEDYGNYRTGTNRYTIVTRDAEGKILDVLLYVITKK